MKSIRKFLIAFTCICILLLLFSFNVYSYSDNEIGIYDSKYIININSDVKQNNLLKEYTLPKSYNLADYLDIRVRNQEQTGFCWAFTSSNVFETVTSKYKGISQIIEYSPKHLVYATSRYFQNNAENRYGFNKRINEGGIFANSIAYYASGMGPVLEKDMPFVNSMELINISEIQNKQVQMQLEDAIVFPNVYKSFDSYGNVTYTNGSGVSYTNDDMTNFRSKVKEHIIKYGALGSRSYLSNNYDYFNTDRTAYFCNNKNIVENHAITIVGWDDNYSKNNFKNTPKNDGAYIVLDSQGSSFNANGGYYYVSYDDIFIEKEIFGIKSVSDVDYDNIYQYDYLGMSEGVYNTSNTKLMYGANVFKKKSNSKEYLTEIGYYSYDNVTSTFWLNSNGTDKNINNLIKLGSEINTDYGYHTFKLSSPIEIKDNFAIVVQVESDKFALLPIETKTTTSNLWDTAFSNSGESYYSYDGIEFYDITENNNTANICIKAFTVNEKYIINNNWKIVNGTQNIMLTGISKGTSISELLNSNNYISNCVVKAYNSDDEEISSGIVKTGTKIKIFENGIIKREYVVVIYGDTNLDGDISSIDASGIVQNKLNIKIFDSDIKLEARKSNL